MKIHQLVSGFRPGDAISHNALSIQHCFKSELKVESNIYSESQHVDDAFKSYCMDYQMLNPHLEEVIFLHYSIDTPITDYFLKLNCRKVLIYHNVTPAKYFLGVAFEKVVRLMQGRERLKDFKDQCGLYLADSQFNADELNQLGLNPVSIIPLMIDYAYLDTSPDSLVLKNNSEKSFNILFVGRTAPNKKIENLIHIFYLFNKTVTDNSKLFIVGMHVGMEKYYGMLQKLVNDYGLQNKVIFTNFVSTSQLIAYYKIASIFLCLSEHEGFCVPLVEAMKMKVPILALDRGAVKETIGKAGLIFNEVNFPYVVEVMAELYSNAALSNNLIKLGQERFQELSLENTKKIFLKTIKNLWSKK